MTEASNFEENRYARKKICLVYELILFEELSVNGMY